MGYQNKKKGNKKDDKYKVRLVVGGFFQTHGIDFEETFAFIAKFVSIRILMSLGATLDLDSSNGCQVLSQPHFGQVWG
jgi:hypothetical protein